MKYEQILYDVEANVATITLNRPDRLNAWTRVIKSELRAAMRCADLDDSVRVIVLTGAGRGFCAGADSSGLRETVESAPIVTEPDPPYDADSDVAFQTAFSYFPAVRKPIIAAINGPAAGIGMILCLYADIRFASDAALFSTAFARRGLHAEYGIAWLLPRSLGMSNAADILLSARKFGASEAKEMGLVSRIFPCETFMNEVLTYARQLASEVSPRSLKVIKRELWAAQFQTLRQAIDAADLDAVASLKSEDFAEGVAHFVEKRAPRFTGR